MIDLWMDRKYNSKTNNGKEGSKEMQNLDIRTLVKECGVQYQSIAKELGVTPVWMSRMMSRPLSASNKIRILRAIDKLKSESKDEL